MRTTLDISEDVLLAVKELSKRERKSSGQVLSELARIALQSTSLAPKSEDQFLGFRPLPRRGIVVTSELIEHLREEEGV